MRIANNIFYGTISQKFILTRRFCICIILLVSEFEITKLSSYYCFRKSICRRLCLNLHFTKRSNSMHCMSVWGIWWSGFSRKSSDFIVNTFCGWGRSWSCVWYGIHYSEVQISNKESEWRSWKTIKIRIIYRTPPPNGSIECWINYSIGSGTFSLCWEF